MIRNSLYGLVIKKRQEQVQQCHGRGVYRLLASGCRCPEVARFTAMRSEGK
jgi:hypothetical protein